MKERLTKIMLFVFGVMSAQIISHTSSLLDRVPTVLATPNITEQRAGFRVTKLNTSDELSNRSFVLSRQLSKSFGAPSGLATTLRESSDQVFNVRKFGAIGDGKSDDTAAINKAIAALLRAPKSLQGGVIYLPRGKYKISSGLTLGNGTPLAPATRGYISFVGDGDGPTDAELTPPGGATAPTVLQWYGEANGTMVTVNGPIGGVRIQGILFEAKAGKNAAATSLLLNHVMNSEFRNLTMTHNVGTALIVTAYPDTTAAADGGNDNLFENIRIQSLGPGGKALQLGPALMKGGILDVARNVFLNSNLMGIIEIRATDSDTFIHVQGGTVRVIPPPDNLSLPGTISFYNCPLAIDTSSGSDWGGSHPLSFYPHPTGDLPGPPLARWARGVTTDGQWFENGQILLANRASADATVELLRLHNTHGGTSAASRLSFSTGPTPTESGFMASGRDGSAEFYAALGSGAGEAIRIVGTKVGIGTKSPTSALQVVGLPVHADNEAAIAGGLTVGAFYRTGKNPDVVCVVH